MKRRKTKGKHLGTIIEFYPDQCVYARVDAKLHGKPYYETPEFRKSVLRGCYDCDGFNYDCDKYLSVETLYKYINTDIEYV